MFIIELNEGEETLEDIERICEHLMEHDKLAEAMTASEREALAHILRPTLDADHNEDEKRQYWERLVNEFVIEDSHGNPLRFYRDEDHQRLYFGDDKGFKTIEALADQELGRNS